MTITLLVGSEMSYEKRLALGVAYPPKNTLSHLILLILIMGIQKPIIIVMHVESVPPR